MDGIVSAITDPFFLDVDSYDEIKIPKELTDFSLQIEYYNIRVIGVQIVPGIRTPDYSYRNIPVQGTFRSRYSIQLVKIRHGQARRLQGGVRSGHDSYRPIFPKGVESIRGRRVDPRRVRGEFFMTQSEKTLFLALI